MNPKSNQYSNQTIINCNNEKNEDFLSQGGQILINEDIYEYLSDDENISEKLNLNRIKNLDNSNKNFKDSNLIKLEDNTKKDFIYKLLENEKLLESLDENTLLASVKFAFEISLYKKCVFLCV